MRVLITGATGFIGRHLLESIDEPVVLTRRPDEAAGNLPDRVEVHAWEAPREEIPPAEAFEGVEAVVNLAGEPIASGRWSDEKKDRIRGSRVEGTGQLVRRLETLDDRPGVLVSGSAIGYYGSRGDAILTEDADPGDDFLADVCARWEEAAREAEDLGMRVVLLRTGIVLGTDGGALQKMLTPFKLCLGGRLGGGHQWMSWIHVDDEVGLVRHALETEEIEGPLNGVAPNPLTNRAFTKTLAGVLGRPAFLPAPAFALKLAFGEMAEATLLASQRCEPEVAVETGYEFRFEQLEPALRDLLGETTEEEREPVTA